MMSNIVEVKDLIKNYTAEDMEVEVLKGINLEVEKGEYTCIMGRSGCGKTTLLKTLGMIELPTTGSLHFKGRDTKELWKDELADIRRREIGFIFQDFSLMDSLSAAENIMVPMILEKVEEEEMHRRVAYYAEQLEITHLLKKAPYQLSGGEKQRVAIGRALINDPDLILADEPTGNLDAKSGQRVTELLEYINSTLKKTVIMVTHDPQIASGTKKVLLLKDGIVLDTMSQSGDKQHFHDEIFNRMKEL